MPAAELTFRTRTWGEVPGVVTCLMVVLEACAEVGEFRLLIVSQSEDHDISVAAGAERFLAAQHSGSGGSQPVL